MTAAILGCTPKQTTEQPQLGVCSAKIVTQDGLQFKDLNGNDTLDRYEDWRLPAEERADDLLAQMTVEEKVGLLLISDMRMEGEPFMGLPLSGEPVHITADFNENDIVSAKNQFTGETLPQPIMNSVGTTKGIKQHKMRHFIIRTNTAADTLAKWTNKLQALAENDRLGIPVLFISNPRNHVASGGLGGTAVSAGVFSQWPSELGLAAMRDTTLVHQFADIARQEWLAVGLRKGYMYMADIATEPRWQRVEGTFGEDAQLAAQTIKAVVRGFQGEKLGNTSIALTTKHFPGGAATYNGFDPHYTYGRNEVFPGGMFSNNLIPFKAAIEAGTSAIMPYYSLPKNTTYPEVAYAYNKPILRGLLRDTLGFKGIINSDTGPIESMPWGVEDLSIEQRYAKALEAGTNMFAGNADPTMLLKAISDGVVDMQYVDESAKYVLIELFELGLFENPYVDETKASVIAGSDEFQQVANLALRKSIVLLRNNNNALPLKKGTKVYFEEYEKSYFHPQAGAGKVHSLESADLNFVSKPDEADVIVLWLKPAMRPLFPGNESPLMVNLSNCAVDVDYINSLTAQKPTILVVNYSNPFVIDEVYNPDTENRFGGVLATFGTKPDALVDVLTGKFNPSGKMPFTTPISNQAVENNREDVPGYLEGDGYALFKFDEGMSY